jgi:hypothetical protein
VSDALPPAPSVPPPTDTGSLTDGVEGVIEDVTDAIDPVVDGVTSAVGL